MKTLNYACPKCANTTYSIGQMRATGSFLTKLLNMQTEKYSTVTCKNCSYTEFYKAKTSALSNIFDLFGG
ncbi:zinc ribbon domain-containing protein [Dokdonia donghaensis]|uniref:zinc ribbon domain-containing protein n=1 Tax=Dokdonia donghaensis TaxID=326320 RepID=UPI0035C7C597